MTVYVPGTDEKDLKKVILSLQQLAAGRSNNKTLISVFDYIPSQHHASITAGTSTYDCIGDILDAVGDANGDYVHFPVGTFNVSDSIERLTSASDVSRSGLRLIGSGYGTVLNATSSSSPIISLNVGYTPDTTSGTSYKYTRGTEIKGFRLTQTGGLTGVDGIELVAAWEVSISDVWMTSLSGNGIDIPYRTDIYSISDAYQILDLEMDRVFISGCTGWGAFLGAGQSPGLWRLHHSSIANCVTGGLFSSTGQFELLNNLFVGNGNDGTGNGNVVLDINSSADASEQGPERVWHMSGNEFDPVPEDCTNVRLYGAQNGEFSKNRLAATAAGTLVEVGLSTTKLCRGNLFARNEIRTGESGVSSYNVTAFLAHSGVDVDSVPLVKENLFVQNEFQPAFQTSGLTKYSGFHASGKNQILETGTLVRSAGQGSPVIATRTEGGTLGTTAAAIVFAVESQDVDGLYNVSSGTFTARSTGTHRVHAQITLEACDAAQQISLYWRTVAGTTLLRAEHTCDGTVVEQSISLNGFFQATAGDTFQLWGVITTTGRDFTENGYHNFLCIEACP